MYRRVFMRGRMCFFASVESTSHRSRGPRALGVCAYRTRSSVTHRVGLWEISGEVARVGVVTGSFFKVEKLILIYVRTRQPRGGTPLCARRRKHVRSESCLAVVLVANNSLQVIGHGGRVLLSLFQIKTIS